MKALLLIIFLLGNASNIIQAQSNSLDSLLTTYNKAGNANNVDLLQKIAIEYKNQYKAEKAIEYAQKMLAIGRQKEDRYLISLSHEIIAEAYNVANELSKSLAAEKIALQYVNKEVNSTLLADIYSGFAAIFLNTSNYDSAIVYTNKGLAVNKALNNNRGQATGNFFLAVIEVSKGNNAGSIIYYDKALDFIRKTDARNYEAQILSRVATVYINLGDYPHAIEKCLQSLSLTENGTLKGRSAVAYTRLGSLYRKMGNLEKALEYYDKAKETIDRYGVMGNNIAVLNMEYGMLYDTKGAYNKAIEFKKKSLAFNDKIELNDQVAEDNSNIAVSYTKLGQHKTALKYLHDAIQACRLFSDSSLILGTIYSNMADLYLTAPDTALASMGIQPLQRQSLVIESYNNALKAAKAGNNIETQKDILEKLSAVYENQNDYPKAFDAFKKFIEIKDMMFNDKSKQQIERLEIESEYNKKKDSINLEQVITNNKLQQQRFLNQQQAQNLLLQQNKYLLSQQQLTLIKNEKDLQHLAFLKTQAELQSEQLQKNQNEKLLTLAEKDRTIQAAQVTSLTQENDLNKFKRWQQFIFSLVGLFVISLAGLYFFNRNKHKQQQLKAALAKEKAEQQQNEAEFQRSIADVSLSALRSQMNPHFIFNCLNSIKLYTTQNETEAAGVYLTKFSKLIRMALENSRSETVTLQNELESLELYIQLEAMRFKDKLKYQITIDKNIDSLFIEIPPLLLQPYVENAIWHGLMHKDEGGRIDLNISTPVDDDDILIITIKDDGVGREKSALLRGKSAAKHKSHGTKVTAERIDMINKIYDTKASVIIEDVINKNNEIVGTLVTIKISVK